MKKFARSKYDSALYQTAIYKAWSNMKTRCRNSKIRDFSRYGGRGISICKKWDSFAGFYSDMGKSHRHGTTLERIDNNKGYSKVNCRWDSKKAQANNRRSNRFFRIDGETKTLSQWIEKSGQKSSTVRQRFYVLKWPILRALGMEVCHR